MSKKKPRPIPVPAQFIPGLIDAHTHLTSCRDDIATLVARAGEAGVDKLCTVGDGLEEAGFALDAARQFDNVWAACAIHPTKAGQLDEVARQRLTEMVADPACVAVGETGLDTYWITHDPENTADLETQEEALRWHIDLSVSAGKTLMLHNREADADLMRVLADAPAAPNTILHCFSSPLAVQDGQRRAHAHRAVDHLTADDENIRGGLPQFCVRAVLPLRCGGFVFRESASDLCHRSYPSISSPSSSHCISSSECSSRTARSVVSSSVSFAVSIFSAASASCWLSLSIC